MDYEEIHAPVMSDVGFRMIVLISIERKWMLRKLDVEAAFLLGKLDENIYVTIPKGFEDEGKSA